MYGYESVQAVGRHEPEGSAAFRRIHFHVEPIHIVLTGRTQLLSGFKVSDFDFRFVSGCRRHSDLDGTVRVPINGRVGRREDYRTGAFAFHYEIAIAYADSAPDELPVNVGCREEVLP